MLAFFGLQHLIKGVPECHGELDGLSMAADMLVLHVKTVSTVKWHNRAALNAQEAVKVHRGSSKKLLD